MVKNNGWLFFLTLYCNDMISIILLQVYHYHNRNNQQNANRPQHGNAAAAGQNAVQAQPAAGPAAAAAAAAAPAADGTAAIGFQPYIRPPMFTFKVNSSH